MFEISFNQVLKYMGTSLILEDLSFQVFSGERVGIVGANGCGKSTILKLIAGIEPFNLYIGSWSVGYDRGRIAIPKEATVAYLDQIPDYEEKYTVLDVLNLAFEEVVQLEQQLRTLEEEMKVAKDQDLERVLRAYSSVSSRYEVQGGYEIHEKLSKICAGLKFDAQFLKKPFHLLSGGEKTTVVLGKILMDRPDILLLDEPTNHLDTDAIEWLEEYLSSYSGIIIIVSHDRFFLDNVVTKIIEIEDLTGMSFKGNYSSYVEQKEELMRIQYDDFKDQQKEIKTMEKQVNMLRDWAMRADNNKFFKRAASIQIKLNKMERVKKPMFEKANMRLNLKAAGRTGTETIKSYDLCKSYEQKTLFKDAELLVEYGERVALIGPNGSGKTTFLKMLLGKENLDSGRVEFGSNVKPGYLPQHIEFNDEDVSVLECFREDFDISEGKGREYLAKFMFFGSTVFKKVSYLSGGERIRLKLAIMLYENINVLILDEPTNHLDIESIETVEGALESFNGTIFFISHDRFFINKVAERVIAIENFGFKSYPGNYSDYKEELKKIEYLKEDALLKIQENDMKKNTGAEKSTEKSIEKKSTVKPRPISTVDVQKKNLEKLEFKISELEKSVLYIDEQMKDCEDDYEKLGTLYAEKDELSTTLEILWVEWETLTLNE